MNALPATTGQRLGSVALRYRQPICSAISSAAISSVVRLPTAGPRARRFLWTDKPGNDVPPGRGPNARNLQATRLEAVLFLAREPLGSRKLAQLAGLADGTRARTLVRKLNRLYDAQGSAFRVEEVAGGFQLMSRPKFAPWLRRLHQTSAEVRLSAPAMETLAVVAYRQPVLRADVEAVRGVQCGEILRQLIERDLARIAGHSEELGRPLLYGTTKRFLQVFGLRHLDELPRAELMRLETTEAGRTDTGQDGRQMVSLQNSSCEVEEEESNVSTLTPTQPLDQMPASADVRPASLSAIEELRQEQQPVDQFDDEDEDVHADEDGDGDKDVDDFDEDEDYDDEDDDDDEDDEDEDDDFDDEPWEEVDDDDEDEDEDDDEDDWDDEDEDWDDDEDEDEEDEGS